MLDTISDQSFVEDLRDYAKGKKGELAFFINDAADRIEVLLSDVERLRRQIDAPQRITDREPTAEEVEYAGDTGFILCISGRDGNRTYDHAIVMEVNTYEDGEWYLYGVKKADTVTVDGWMLPPEWKD